jgi:hypothetical protein
MLLGLSLALPPGVGDGECQAAEPRPQPDTLDPRATSYGGFVSIAGASFVSASSTNSYIYMSWGGVKMTSPGTALWPFMVASVELPEGATVTAVTLYYYDPDPSEWILLSLSRYDGAGGVNDMASVASANDGMNQKTDTSVSYAVVDNAHYSYLLSAEMEAQASAPDVVLYGAKITYIPSASAPPGPLGAAAAGSPPVEGGAAIVSGLLAEETAPLLHSGGEVRLLAPAPAADGETLKDAPRAEPGDLGLQGVSAGLFDWKQYTVAGSNLHPMYSNTEHTWSGGGGRYVTSAPTLSGLVAPLNLVHGKTIQHAHLTYYDVSDQNPALWLYRADRQGNGILLWTFVPEAAGGYLVATSPYLGEVVDNQAYAYYFVVRLGDVAAGSSLQAMEVEISYVGEIYLPVVLRQH